MDRAKQKKATFQITIEFREHATWQGRITWAEKNKTIGFRSALEMMRLLDEAEKTDGRTWEEAKDAVRRIG